MFVGDLWGVYYGRVEFSVWGLVAMCLVRVLGLFVVYGVGSFALPGFGICCDILGLVFW